MPNHIKNRITLKGDPNRIHELIEKFSTYYPAKINRTTSYKNERTRVICQDSNGKFAGWFNDITAEFEFSKDRSKVVGLPDGFEFEVNQAFQRFPDFDKIIPMPEILHGTTSPNRVNAQECIDATGYPSWYEWSNAVRGTKWNCYSCEKKSWNIFEFETAWSGVPKLIGLLHDQFKDVEVLYEFSDEDTGYNCGTIHFKNGSVTENYPQGGSNEAYELAIKLRPHLSEYYHLVDGNWEYKDNE